MAWRIEEAKTDRSSCRQCGQRIARGEHRFGNDDMNALWYHLGCAATGKPVAFKPFAKKAAALMPKTAAKPAAKKAGARNPALEAKLAANPDDDTRAVYADWLQSNGDPWGEIIALELAGKEADAKKLFKQHGDALAGGLAPRMFGWHKGFIDRIQLERRASVAQQKQTLETLFALPATLLVRELVMPGKLDAACIAVVNQQAPRTVTKVFMWLVDAAGGLALPNLEQLDLFGLSNLPAPSVAAFTPLFEAKHVPKLRRLSIGRKILGVPMLAALLDSKLLRQLTCLELAPFALDEEGVAYIKKRKRDLAHIEALNIGGVNDVFEKQERAFQRLIADE